MNWKALNVAFIAFLLLPSIGLSVPCDLNSLGNTVFNTTIVCEGDLGNTTGNITINDGVLVEFRGATISFEGANATIRVEGSVIFNRTTILRTKTISTDGWNMVTKNADSPTKIYNAFFNFPRKLTFERDGTVIEGLVTNGTTGGAPFYNGIYLNNSDRSSIKNLTVLNSLSRYPFYIYSSNFVEIDGITLINPRSYKSYSYSAYLYRVNNSIIKNINHVDNSYVIYASSASGSSGGIKNMTYENIKSITGYTGVIAISANSAPSGLNGVILRNSEFIVNKSSGNYSTTYFLIDANAYLMQNVLVENIKGFDMVRHESGMKMPFRVFAASGNVDFKNVTLFNTTGMFQIDYPYYPDVTSRYSNYWYFQPHVTMGGSPLSGLNVTLQSRFGTQHLVTGAEGYPYGNANSLFLGVRVNGTTISRYLYNVTVDNQGEVLFSINNTLLNNSNWNMEISITEQPIVETGYQSQFGVIGIIGGSIDTVTGLLIGLASMSQDIGSLVAVAFIILLITGAIGVIILKFNGEK